MALDVLPFKIDLHDSTSMTDQVVAGLRQAIRTGFYQMGSRIPSLTEMSKQLGVSLIVVRRAVARLAEDGFLNPRQGYGVVVSNPQVSCWNGTVLFITSEHKSIYFTHFIVEILNRRLLREGYILSHVVLTRNDSGDYEFEQLEQNLIRNVRLAIVYHADKSILQYLNEHKCPYVAREESVGAPDDGCVGHFLIDYRAALCSVVGQAFKDEIKDVLIVSMSHEALLKEARNAFEIKGIKCRQHLVSPLPDLPRPESVQRAALNDFLSATGPLREPLPDLFFFTDDYIAAGSLTAMLVRGVDVPKDVKVVSFANVGLGPVFYKGVARMSVDARGIGKRFTNAILKFLKTGSFPDHLCLPVSYFSDDTFPG